MSLDQLRLIPQDEDTLRALSQQVLCWARRDGRPDTRVKIGTGWNSHVVVPPGLCQVYGAPSFTSLGQAITCPEPGEGQKTYYITADDVTPINIADCTPIDQLPAPTGLGTDGITDTAITVNWTGVAGADGYTVEWSTDGAEWTAQAAGDVGTYQITGLTAETAYQIRVKATDSTGAMGDSAYATTDAQTLPAGG